MMRAFLRAAAVLACMTVGFAHAQNAGIYPDACVIVPRPANCEGLQAIVANRELPRGDYVHVPDPPCGGNGSDRRGVIERTISQHVNVALRGAGAPGFVAGLAGDVAGGLGRGVDERIRNNGGDLARALNSTDRYAACWDFLIKIPTGAQVVGYRLATSDHWARWQPILCSPGQDCGSCNERGHCGWFKFRSEPNRIERDGNVFYTVTAANWSHERPRMAIVVLFIRYNGTIPRAM